MHALHARSLRSDNRPRRSAWRAALFALALSPCVALAQAPEPVPAPGAATPGAPVAFGRNYTIDAALVVVLFGGAIFVVCRSSQRV